MANFIVENGNDSGVGSLRQAIANANRSPGLDTISLNHSVTLNSAISITDSVEIIGLGNTVVTQTGTDSLFIIDDGDRNNLSEVSFTGVSFTGANGTAIYSSENLSLSDGELYGNLAIDNGYYSANAAIQIDSATLSLERISIHENNGGVSSFQAKVKITDSNISHNSSDDFFSEGAGINLYDGSSLELTNSLVANNKAGYSGGGISVGYGSEAEISHSTITGNSSEYRGGGISVSRYGSLKLDNTAISDNYALLQGGGIDVVYYSQIEISDSLISGNTVEIGEGGGISIYSDSQARIANSLIENNFGSDGAGVNVRHDSSLELVSSTITGNISDYRAGGISIGYDSSFSLANSTVADNTTYADGGGVLVHQESQARISNSTITDNAADSRGGGIVVTDDSSLNLADSIITGNTANQVGGGISVGYDSLLNLVNSEIADNFSDLAGGGVLVYSDSQVQISNSTISGNTVDSSVGGGVSVNSRSQAKITDSIIEGNSADQGSGIYAFSYAQVEVSNSTITGNAVTSRNGSAVGTYEGSSSIALINSQVTDNSINDLRGTGIEKFTTQIIEAEDLTDFEAYRLETRSAASGGKLLSLRRGAESEIGKASFNFTGIAGHYNVKIGTYDEDDGEATIQFDLDGDVLGSVVLDQNPGGLGVSANTQVTLTVGSNVFLEAGDLLSFTGFEKDEEHARIDFIELEPVSSLDIIIDELKLLDFDQDLIADFTDFDFSY